MSVIAVNDSLVTYQIVAEKLRLDHQVYQCYVRGWVGRKLHELREPVPKKWQWVSDEIKRLLTELLPKGR